MSMMLSPGGCCCGPTDDCYIRTDEWTDGGGGVPTGWTLESGSVTFEADGTLTLAAGTRLVRSWNWDVDPVVIVRITDSPSDDFRIGCDAVAATESDLRRFGQYALARSGTVSLLHRLAAHPTVTTEPVNPASYPGWSIVDSDEHLMRSRSCTWSGYLLFSPTGFVKQWNDGMGTGDYVADLRSRDNSLSVHAIAPYGYAIDPLESAYHALERWIVDQGAGNSPLGSGYGLLFPPQSSFAENNDGSELRHDVLVIESDAEMTIGPVRVENFCHVAPSWGGGFVESEESAWSFSMDLAFDFEGIYLPRLLPSGTQILVDTSTLNLGGTVSWSFGDPSFSFIQYTGELYQIAYDDVTFTYSWELSEAGSFPWDNPTGGYATIARSQTFSGSGFSGPETIGSHSKLIFPTLSDTQFQGEIVLIWDEATQTTTILISIGVGTYGEFGTPSGPQYQYIWGKTVAGPLDESTQSHVLPLLNSFGEYGDTPLSSWAIGDLTISW